MSIAFANRTKTVQRSFIREILKVTEDSKVYLLPAVYQPEVFP